jgi:hypothetical protein
MRGSERDLVGDSELGDRWHLVAGLELAGAGPARRRDSAMTSHETRDVSRGRPACPALSGCPYEMRRHSGQSERLPDARLSERSVDAVAVSTRRHQ